MHLLGPLFFQVILRILSTKSTISQNKIAKIGKLTFHSFKHIAHFSCKNGHFWGEEGMVCISLIGTRPVHPTEFFFCFIPGFLALFILLSSNNNSHVESYKVFNVFSFSSWTKRNFGSFHNQIKLSARSNYFQFKTNFSECSVYTL